MSISYKIKKLIPDKMYICMQYYKHFHNFPNLKNPKTFNEKLQWLKLHDRNPEYVKMVDIKINVIILGVDYLYILQVLQVLIM